MSALDSTLILDRATVRTTLGAVQDALGFLLDALHGSVDEGPEHARRGALSLHQAAAGLALLADQAEAAASAPPAGVIDLAQARRHRRHVRRSRPTLTGAPR